MKAKYIIISAGIMLLGCNKNEQFELPKPESFTSNYMQSGVFFKGNTSQQTTTLSQDGTYQFEIQASSPSKEEGKVTLADEASLEKIVQSYNTFKGVKDYKLLPSEYYSFSGDTYQKGVQNTQASLTLKEYTSLEQGNYLLPLKLQMEDNDLFHMVIIRKDADYVALSETSKKPMPPASYTCSERTEPMKMVAYVETNDWDIRNMGQFLLKDSKKPVFDIVILFAPNMNYNAKTGKRVLSFNDKLQPIVNDPDKYIKPLKDRGIKVLATILPNHQGVGYFNFQNYDEALDFARECKKYADKLGLDGYDIDEEYARYDVLPSKPIKAEQSMFWFMKAMKEVMPDKLLTLYDYGHGMSPADRDENGKAVKDYIDYSWANYNEEHQSYAGVPAHLYGQDSVEASIYGTDSSGQTARTNLEQCNGLMMVFNIQGTHIKSGKTASDLSQATRLFYGEDCIFVGEYHKGHRDN